MLRDQRGQALPVVLLVLILGVSFITPAIYYANSSLIAQRRAKEALVEQYSASSANTYVSWRLLDTNYSNAPPPTETVSINGMSVPVSIAAVPSASIIDASATTTVNATLPANHEIWAVVNIPTTAAKDVAMAYDTTGAPSHVVVPFTTGNVTYYLHNSPTPPTGDAQIPAAETSNPYTILTMDTNPPTATTLYNYDKTDPAGANRDTVAGRWIEKKAEGTNCADKVLDGYRYRIAWRSPIVNPTSGVTINGTVILRWWWATQDGSNQTSQTITWWLCKYDPTKAVSIPLMNPNSLFASPGKIVPTRSLWTKPFDLRAVAGLTNLSSRVDRVSGTAIRVRSWQLSAN